MEKQESIVRPEVNDAIDALEDALLQNFPSVVCPLKHEFGDNLYIRKIIMPAGSRVTSKIHKHRHPFFVLVGKVKVWTAEKGWEVIEAPFDGITEPGTRRVLHVLEDTYWITVHSNPNDTRDLKELEEWVIEPHENQLLKIEKP